MSNSSLHVLIIGGGLGGLCLAQGLRQAGINATVYEREQIPGIRRQGYRLHIDTRGASGLRACLPTRLFELFLATTSQPGQRVTVLNKQLRVRKTVIAGRANSSDLATFSAAIDRLTLRELLLAGLDESIHFNKEFSRYELEADGSVRAFFTDGTEAHGDVLVGADGVHSRVRRQFLPEADVIDTGARCIYGKTLLTEETRARLPTVLQQGFTVVAGLRFSLALGLVEFLHPPAEAAARLAPEIQFHTTGSYLMWSFNAKRKLLTATDNELFRMNGEQLQQMVLNKIKSWHPDLRALIAASEPEEIFPIAVRVADICPAWSSTSITLLGDAIHAMSPAGGSGANMALRDAHQLCQALISVAGGTKPLPQALHEYETPMLKAGFEAVRFSARGGVFTRRP